MTLDVQRTCVTTKITTAITVARERHSSIYTTRQRKPAVATGEMSVSTKAMTAKTVQAKQHASGRVEVRNPWKNAINASMYPSR